MSKRPQSATGLFFSMLLRAMVVILGIAILAFGAFFIMQLMKHGAKKGKEPATTVNENVLTEVEVPDELLTIEVTEEATGEEQPAEADSKSLNILVLNSTDIQGLAGRWCETLNSNGYNNTMASDFSETQSTTRVIVRQDGVGADVAALFPGATYEVGEVPPGSGEPTENYDIVVIVGTDNSDH